nr:hypothetical protein [Tanacetum cinerariifolium]
MQTQTSNTLHNAIMEAGSKDRPLMLAPDWKDIEVLVSERSPITTTARIHETYKNVLQEIRDQLDGEAEAVQIILTGIDNDIYSIVDACPNASERIARVANPLALVAQQQPVYHPQNHPTHYTQNSSTRSQQAATRNRGKTIVNSPQPIYDLEPSMVVEDDETSKDKEIDKHMALISLSNAGYENQRNGNIAGARENVGSSVVQKSRIQCYNCKEFRHVARECQKPKRAKDAAYHREKMLLCKQEEARIQLNAKQAVWRDDTDDDELEDQELKAHYMYMAKLQEVSLDSADSGPIFDDKPVQKVSNDDHYNVFAMESVHLEQTKSVHDTYPIEQDAQNVIIDSLDMNYDREEIDQNDDDNDLAKERELLASLIEKLKYEIDESKNRNKFLETSNKVLIEKLKENYVPWSSRLLRYAKSRPNGKLIHNSILNGPYVRKMILEPVQQMMKGSDIEIQEKKAKLFNEWERFTSNEGELIESYYHRFLKLMNDLKRNKHFPEKIASNLKFLNNLQPEWSRHVTIVLQTKDLHTADCTQLYDFLKYNQKERISSNLRNRQIAQPGMSMGQDRQIQIVEEEYDLMAAVADLDEIEEVNANCILMANLQQASTSGTQTDSTPVYDTDGSAKWGNILITRVYFVEGLGHNLFSVGQFFDSDLEVAFRKDACFVRNLEGVDLLEEARSTNLYTINLHEMAFPSPICLMARLPKFKYHKEHLCSSCEQGKSKRASHPPKPVPNLRTMLIFSRAPLLLWAEAIATACFTQNCFIIHHRFNKTPYELINEIKSDISFLHVFGALCYLKNDREDIGKLGAKGDIGFFIGYSANSCAYRVYNHWTKKIMKNVNVSFDELFAMAFEQRSSKLELQIMTSGQISSGLDLTYAPSTITTQQPSEGELDLLFEAVYDDYIGGEPSATARTVPPAQDP